MPDLSNIRNLQFLSNACFGYGQKGLIGRELCHRIPIVKSKGYIRVHDVNRDGTRIMDSTRSPGTESKQIDFDYGDISYSAKEHSLKIGVYPEHEVDADPDINLKKDSARIIKSVLETELEYNIASLVGVETSYPAGSRLSPAIKWDAANPIPNDDINTIHQAIYDLCGNWPTHAAMGSGCYKKLKYTPTLLEQFQYVSGGKLDDDQLKHILDVPNLLVGPGHRNTALPGQPPVISQLWSDDTIIFLYKPDTYNSPVETACFGLFEWPGDKPKAPNSEVAMWEWWEQLTRTDWVEGFMGYGVGKLIVDTNDLVISGGALHGIWT